LINIFPKQKDKYIYGLVEYREALLNNSADNAKKVKGDRYNKKFLKEFSGKGL
tara:strand:- start:272 stop:430 length:159 start_codon:yes stop_codon:yes gene_type:complete